MTNNSATVPYSSELPGINIKQYSDSMKPADIDTLIGKNLRRLRQLRKLSQEQLGTLVKNDKTKISAIENGKEGMGKVLMARFCEVLNVQLYEFYVDNKTPVIQDKEEINVLHIYRQARDLNHAVAEKIPEYGKFVIKETKKSTLPSARKGAGVRNNEN